MMEHNTHAPCAADAATERRQTMRQPVIRRCRIRDRRSLLFASGITQNCSKGGVLVGLPVPRPLAIGDAVEVLVAWAGDALVQANAPTHGRVVRIEDHQGEQRIAVAFDEPVMERQVNPVRIAA